MAPQHNRKPIGRRPAGEGRKTFWACVAAAVLVCGVGLFQAWTRVAVLNRSYELGRARADSERLSRELEKLRLEVATLQSTARVDREAHGKLAMSKPPPGRVVVVDPPSMHADASTALLSPTALAVNER